jgi:hypothetical protein
MFERCLYLPDADPLHAILATVQANRMDGDPVWLMNVSAPGSGKTTLLDPLASLPDVFMVGTMTEASLLSGTPKREAAKDASGGLLREVGSRGLLVLKDFGSILSMRPDSRNQLLAALREVYDGSWTRRLGTDGGRTLTWQGKLGLIAAVTPTIDNHHAITASLGERFLYVRMTVPDAHEHARRSIMHKPAMRRELAEAVAAFFARDQPTTAQLEPSDIERLVALSTYVARCRSSVERDGYTREIVLVPDAEAPGRLAGALGRILTGLRAIGTADRDAWRVTQRIGFDSMPAQRRATVDYLAEAGEAVAFPTVAQHLGLPQTTARRVVGDIAALRLIERTNGAGTADYWQLHPWTRSHLGLIHNGGGAAQLPLTPETSHTH